MQFTVWTSVDKYVKCDVLSSVDKCAVYRVLINNRVLIN